MLLQPEVEGPLAACAPRVQPPSYTVHRTKDGRLYYCNHVTRTSSWLPPLETWSSHTLGFPYGWEQALQPDGKPYFINHLNRTTTFEDPRKDWTEEPPQPRQLRLHRHPDLGFGFVAGSEKPVIVRFVTEGGPSEDKLQPGDQILSINGEDVKRAPRDHVIQLVRACKEFVELVVCQPPLDNSARKSALLSAAKKAKLKSNPSRVRFAEGVVVNGSPLFPPSAFSVGDAAVPCMPNVLKVFLENGQTKSFKYDGTTTVRDVVLSLQQKLCIKALEHFSLVVEHVKSLRRNKLTLLDPQEPLARIAARPGAHNLRCLFRVAFVPRDACELAQRDLVAFEYLYMQCCNDVVQERYAPELKYDIALRLAALHIHQHAISNNMTSKVTVKAIEREFGLERFVPISLMASMRRKELRKLIGHFLKLNHNLSPTGQKSLTSLQAKLYYLNIISELPSYGAKCFSTSVRVPPFDSNMERVILVSPRFGISQIAGQRNSMPVPLADIEQMSHVTVHREDELTRCVRIHLMSTNKKTNELSFSMEERDAEELVLVLNGYHHLLTGKMLPIDQDKSTLWNEDAAPSYHGTLHNVIAARWSYGPGHLVDPPLRTATFTPPPSYHPYQQPHLDSNMNNMNGNSNGFVGKQPLDQATPLTVGVTMEQLLLAAESEQHVAEMQELVRTSEQYLKDSRHHHHSDSDSDAPPPPGQLKHSDSLLLLTQGQKLSAEQVTEAVRNSVELDEVEPSESDTDSMSTPTNSPIRRAHEQRQEEAGLQQSASSFGLHSPDNLLPEGLRHGNLHDLLKKLQEDNTLPYAFAEGTLYLDPDIIDLTMIPPPITPDEDGSNGLPIPLNIPPTPFADQPGGVSITTLDQLLAHELNRALPVHEDDTIDSDLNLDLSLDLEAFLATVAVPPPTNQAPPAVELTPEEILAYIIPPPPEDHHPPSIQSTTHKTNGTSNNPVIEYSTLPRQHKPGPFSCCGKSVPNTNLDTGIHQPPPRPPKNNYLDSHPPPQLPPKGLDTKPPHGPRRLCHTLPRNGHMVPFALTQHNRDMLLTRSDAAIEDMLEKLAAVAIACTKSQSAGGGPKMDERLFEIAKESLTSEARQLVTASKLLVKSASAELECQELADQLATCLNHLRRMTDLSADVAAFTSAPLQTRNLVTKVRDVVAVFKDTLTSALDTREKPDSILLRRAENLASVLATLLRSLRVFSP